MVVVHIPSQPPKLFYKVYFLLLQFDRLGLIDDSILCGIEVKLEVFGQIPANTIYPIVVEIFTVIGGKYVNSGIRTRFIISVGNPNFNSSNGNR